MALKWLRLIEGLKATNRQLVLIYLAIEIVGKVTLGGKSDDIYTDDLSEQVPHILFFLIKKKNHNYKS